MAEKPKEPIYKPPDLSACTENDFQVDLGDGHFILVVQRIYRDKIVWFAIMQFYELDGVRHQISRIDCCHGAIHRHVLDRKGSDLMEPKIIRQIVVGKDAWATVDSEFLPCYDRITNEFGENYRRWENE